MKFKKRKKNEIGWFQTPGSEENIDTFNNNLATTGDGTMTENVKESNSKSLNKEH